jgi:hypothetical protein
LSVTGGIGPQVKEVTVMKEVVFHDEDPNGPFGTGPAAPEPYVDPIFEQFGDYDAFGPFAWREIDYTFDVLDADDDEE